VKGVAPRSHGTDAGAGWNRTTSGPFRFVRPHGDRFDVHFHDGEESAALEELREYRRSWESKLFALQLEAGRATAEGAPRGRESGRLGFVGAAARRLGGRSREEVLLTYQIEDLRRTLGTIDDAIERLGAYVASRSGTT